MVVVFARLMCDIAHMSTEFSTALVVDDDPAIVLSAELLLGDYFTEVVSTSMPEAAVHLAAECRPDVVLLDMNFTRGATDGVEGFATLRSLLAMDPDCVVVIITAHADVDVAVEAMKLGATDFVQKPWTNERLLATARSAAALRASRRDASKQQQRAAIYAGLDKGGGPLLGSSGAMRRIVSQIERAAPTDANVLILGENGTGKELVARELHRRSLRASAAMVSVDLGALGHNLIESELFGHIKGAFTDARSDRIGRFQAADGGTLFLDELSNLPLHMQPKLLTALEQRHTTPVGSNKVVQIDVRVISATNLPREQLMNDAVFRQDLRFRLDTIQIELLPLRERRSDIPQLADHYLEFYARKYNKRARRLPREVSDALNSYDWPGNVRELRHLVERAVIMADDAGFGIDDFPIKPVAPRESPALTTPSDDMNLKRAECRLVDRALRKHRYNISLAAAELGLTRHSLYRRMEKHGL